MRKEKVFPSVSLFTAVLERLSVSGHSDLLSHTVDLVPSKELMRAGKENTIVCPALLSCCPPSIHLLSVRLHFPLTLLHVCPFPSSPLHLVLLPLLEFYELTRKSAVRGDTKGTLILLRVLSTIASAHSASGVRRGGSLYPSLGPLLVRSMAAQCKRKSHALTGVS